MAEPNTTGNWQTQTPGCMPINDPPAADLETLRARAAPWLARPSHYGAASTAMIRALLAICEVQAARLVAQDTTIRQLAGDLTCADSHSRYVGRNMGGALIANQDLQADRDRLAARLAALEAAARAWWEHSDMSSTEALYDAVAALAAPPEETA